VNFQILNPILSSPLLAQVISLDHNFMSFPWGEKQWKSINEDAHLLFIAGENPVLGFALYQLSPAEELAHLLKIVVAPTEQGKITQDFFAAQKNSLKSRGYSRIYLEVAENNKRAQGFYSKCGFVVLQRVKSYYTDGSAALKMELKI